MIVLTKVRIPRGCTLHIAQSGVGLHSDYIIDFKNRKRQREVKQCKGGEVFFKYVLYAPPPLCLESLPFVIYVLFKYTKL